MLTFLELVIMRTGFIEGTCALVPRLIKFLSRRTEHKQQIPMVDMSTMNTAPSVTLITNGPSIDDHNAALMP